MDPVTLTDLARALDEGRIRGDGVTVTGAAIDSRRVRSGELFVALAGERVDGHDFVAAARTAGASAALVAREVADALPQWVVPDPATTLARLGAWVRAGVPATVIGVTGSNGKTTVKEMLAAILGTGAETLATEGNLNNFLGVPLTLCRLHRGQRFAVIEMGANAPGEIAGLAELAGPTIGIVTNAGPAHLSGFGNIEGVARAKGEMFRGLPPDGVAVINADDDHAPLWRELAGTRRIVTFGTAESADVRVLPDHGERMRLALPGGDEVSAELALPGAHNRMNAAAAAAASLAAGAPPAWIERGLETVGGVAGRLARRRLAGGIELIDDSYNANPASVRAAVDLLAAGGGECWLVLGDMGELGEAAASLHAQTGTYAHKAGIARLFTCGEMARTAAEAFGEGATHCPGLEALVAALRRDLRPGVRVLVKGSRSAAMDRVVAALTEGDDQGVGG
ncbi:UDP-N-acetylmuramoyl-tripeptide--D-alanyl-D-alanine ligase [Arhodomonas sp. AD133]|uniref:UDP-N-acetylmuramoyl-tripeptide--D-alanyl-D- alanine ligase n=1 Tax=Arhodomonas sp. AD133 TaxID=3415009 RepID=UPI003EB9AFDF